MCIVSQVSYICLIKYYSAPQPSDWWATSIEAAGRQGRQFNREWLAGRGEGRRGTKQGAYLEEIQLSLRVETSLKISVKYLWSYLFLPVNISDYLICVSLVSKTMNHSMMPGFLPAKWWVVNNFQEVSHPPQATLPRLLKLPILKFYKSSYLLSNPEQI